VLTMHGVWIKSYRTWVICRCYSEFKHCDCCLFFISVLISFLCLCFFYFVIQLWLRIPLVVPDDDSMDASSATLVSKYPRNMPWRLCLLRFVSWLGSCNVPLCCSFLCTGKACTFLSFFPNVNLGLILVKQNVQFFPH